MFAAQRSFSKLIVRIAIIGIALGLGVMILAMGILKGFKSQVREKIRGFSGDIQIIKLDLNASYENSTFTVDSTTLKNIISYPEITHLQAFATKPGIIKTRDEVEGVVMKGIDASYQLDYLSSILTAGKTINFADSLQASRQIMISQLIADRLSLKVGDDFLMYFVQEPLRKRKFTIVGIFNVGLEDVDKMYVIADIGVIRRLNNWSGNQVGGYEIRIKDFTHLNAVADKVYDSLDVNLKSDTIEELYPGIFQWLALINVNTQVVLLLMLAVAVMNMISALLIMILERTNMIGILKAMGSSNWIIRKIFLYNAGYLIGIGLLLGNFIGIGIGLVQQYTHWFKLDQASYSISFVPVELHLSDIVMLNAGTLLICVLVLLIPSLLVTKISPIRAITFK